MARDGVGELDLHGIEVRVLAYLLQALYAALDVEVVLFHLPQQSLALLARERGRLRRDGIKQYLAREFIIIVVGKLQHRLSKVKAVEILEAANLPKARHVAIGNETHRALLLAFGEVVVILHNHQCITTFDSLLGHQVIASYALVVAVGTAVRTGDDDRLVLPIAVVALLHLLHHLTARYSLHIRKLHLQVWHLVDSILEHTAQESGIVEYARSGLLAHHIIHRGIDHIAIATHHGLIQRRAIRGAHGRQLCIVTNQNQSTILTLTDIFNKVIQERATAENLTLGGGVGEHRRLIDDEDCAPLLVHIEREVRLVVGRGALAVDSLVDGERLAVAVT